MSDLEHFFRRLVSQLAATDPARLNRPVPIAEIQTSILPYRRHRRALGLESSEDYELLLLRLCAGEGGLARTEPPEVQARLRGELAGPNPDLSLLREHGDALVTLAGVPVARALMADSGREYAPPGAAPPGGPPAAPPPGRDPAKETTAPDPSHTLRCSACGGALPAGRAVKFCPFCGAGQTPGRCPACGAEIEAEWRHCIGCGAALRRS